MIKVRVLIWVDTEGIAGIHDPERGFNDNTYKVLTTREINAVIGGLEKAGATEIDIFDGHGMGGNLILDELSPRASLKGCLNKPIVPATPSPRPGR